MPALQRKAFLTQSGGSNGLRRLQTASGSGLADPDCRSVREAGAVCLVAAVGVRRAGGTCSDRGRTGIWGRRPRGARGGVRWWVRGRGWRLAGRSAGWNSAPEWLGRSRIASRPGGRPDSPADRLDAAGARHGHAGRVLGVARRRSGLPAVSGRAGRSSGSLEASDAAVLRLAGGGGLENDWRPESGGCAAAAGDRGGGNGDAGVRRVGGGRAAVAVGTAWWV